MVPVETGERTKPEQETLDSGNVFADMGLTQPAQELLKAGLTFEIYSIIQQRGLTQADAARILGVQQPRVSSLARNRSGDFSVGRLIEFLAALRHDVEITIKPAHKEQGEMSLVGGWRTVKMPA